MNRIAATFAKLRACRQKALVVYITAGHPSLTATAAIIPVIAAAGADLIEVGVPFSDPTADGPIIQKASQHALQGGTSLKDILQLIGGVRRSCPVPLVLFGYYNPIYAYGLSRFASEARKAGIDGILVVDLPPEEAPELKAHTDPAGLDFITLLAPTTPPERIALLTRSARGFLYLVSITGVTGTASPRSTQLGVEIARIREITSLPLVVGFGITTPSQAAEIAPLADGIVIGSALVDLIDREAASADPLTQVYNFVKEFKTAINQK